MTRLVALTLCISLAANVAFAQPRATPKRYALLVGVNVYEHEKIKPLNYAENDAFVMDKELRKQGYEAVLLTDTAGALEACILLQQRCDATNPRLRHNPLRARRLSFVA